MSHYGFLDYLGMAYAVIFTVYPIGGFMGVYFEAETGNWPKDYFLAFLLWPFSLINWIATGIGEIFEDRSRLDPFYYKDKQK